MEHRSIHFIPKLTTGAPMVHMVRDYSSKYSIVQQLLCPPPSSPRPDDWVLQLRSACHACRDSGQPLLLRHRGHGAVGARDLSFLTAAHPNNLGRRSAALTSWWRWPLLPSVATTMSVDSGQSGIVRRREARIAANSAAAVKKSWMGRLGAVLVLWS
jgi:hypothetical protein